MFELIGNIILLSILAVSVGLGLAGAIAYWYSMCGSYIKEEPAKTNKVIDKLAWVNDVYEDKYYGKAKVCPLGGFMFLSFVQPLVYSLISALVYCTYSDGTSGFKEGLAILVGAVTLLYIFLRLSRFGMRVKKKLNQHISDPNAHK